MKTAAVIGAGTMGGGIAMCFADFGIPAESARGLSSEVLDKGIAARPRQLRGEREAWQPDRAEMDRLLHIEPVKSYDDIADCDVVIEAVFERIAVKEEVFKKLDAVMKPGRRSTRTPRASTSTSWPTRPSGRRTSPARISSHPRMS